MPGRRPRPTAILLLEKGKLYGNQAQRAENEPDAVAIRQPICPYHLSPSEKEMWQFIGEILKNYNLFLDINAPLMEVAAVFGADFRNCGWEIRRRGKTIKRSDGSAFENPAIKQRYKSAELYMKAISDLGVSGFGLAKLGAAVVIGKDKKSEMEEICD